jgi:hypothetical protein
MIFLASRFLASVFAGSGIGQGDEVVVADALQDQKHRRRIAGVDDEVRALRRDGISFSSVSRTSSFGRWRKIRMAPVTT